MRYEGLVVEGPLRGERMALSMPFYRIPVYEPPGVAPPYRADIISAVPSLRYFEYQHVVGLRGVIQIDFWVERGGSADHALNLVFDFFEKHATAANDSDA